MERFSHPRPTTRWSGDHHRLHRLLRRHPALLPAGERLLLSVSGGQDSMALLDLLLTLQPQHRWLLTLWHGDHLWRPESSAQAEALASWARDQALALLLDRWQRPEGASPSEASARAWRYECLQTRAQQLGCSRVVTGHTASDRAETLLLNLARGSHRRGLAALPLQRGLAPGIDLARPLLAFSRAETSRICRERDLPVWPDASNSDTQFSRNRLRLEVMPVLEALHPGVDHRLARLAGQLEGAERSSRELLELALVALQTGSPSGGEGGALLLRRLGCLERANQEQLLEAWLERQTGRRWPSRALEALLDRLTTGSAHGQCDLADGWRLRWQGLTLWICRQPERPAR